ncbi:hypothetical protein [Hymenobacter norwichensis]|uniref:hypothetical protein n=1 Tax=Hymenobacter norwichensis TaxID=223903 RepID=UPI0003B54C63|nr:hypothetical protein [Hymenobacter norwichensis]
MKPRRRSTHYRTDKRKIRGGKRHLKRLQRESHLAPLLPIATLQKNHYYYEKLGLHLWHWHHRQPPQQVQQLAVQHLLTTFLAWQPSLTSLPEPYYAAIWLVGPEFAHSSQVAVSTGKHLNNYQERFGDSDPTGPALPLEYRQLPGINQLAWHTYPWEIFVDAYDYPDGWPAWTLQRPNYLWQSEDGSQYLVVQTGWVWVGQLKKSY